MGEFLVSALRALFGLSVFVGICFLLSRDKRRINWRLVVGGILLQVILALLLLKVPFVSEAFNGVAKFFVKLTEFSNEGASFVFGSLVTDEDTFGFIIAFRVLPTIIFFSALSSALYYLGILQRIVFVFAWVMKLTMRLSGAESLAAAANIFIGQTEAPLLIRPYLDKMTRSEIMSLMAGGMATIAGGVFLMYISILGGDDPIQQILFAKHLLIASILSAPASLVFAKILVPETKPVDMTVKISSETIGSNLIDSIVVGTTDGIKLAMNVAGALIAFTALVALSNYVLTNWIGSWSGLNTWVVSVTDGTFDGFSLQFILGVLFAPLAWVIGIEPGDLLQVGQLLGERTVLNEFFAYDSLKNLRESGVFTDPHSVIVTAYALCGFANLVSMGIQVGGIGALAPVQRSNLAALAPRAMMAAIFACLMTACIAGVLI